MRILLIEDASRMAAVLRRGLAEIGHAVEVADDGETGLALALNGDFDLVLLDLNLPRLDGLELLRRLRARRADLPVIAVTARDAVEQRIEGLDLGADDYLTKPFSFAELLARIRAVARRPGARAPADLLYSNLRLDPSLGRAWRGDRLLSLSLREYALLALFMRRAGRTLSRAQLYEGVWGMEYDGLSNVLDVHINHLRNKLEAGGGTRLIHTVRGRGYRLGDES